MQTKFEPQCKTKADVLREAARVLDMCEGTEVEAIYRRGSYWYIISPLNFDDLPENYEFPLAIVEGKLVWRGDKLYNEAYSKDPMIIVGCYGKCLVTQEHGTLCNPSWSWQPPRQDITINGVSVPKGEVRMRWDYVTIRYNNAADVTAAYKALMDKEMNYDQD